MPVPGVIATVCSASHCGNPSGSALPGGCGLKSIRDLLADAAKLFLGKHDFSAFGSPTTPKGTTVRTVMKAEWMQVEKDEWHFEVQADAFLYRMVRRLVFVQVAVAQGKLSG